MAKDTNTNELREKGEFNMFQQMMFSGFQIINLVIALALIGLTIYVLILLIGFLKHGTKAFKKYIESNDEFK